MKLIEWYLNMLANIEPSAENPVMRFFLELYGKIGPVPLVLLFWLLFWPGQMFWTAIFIEKRFPYLGKGQSRMFWPGDFALGAAAVAFLGMYVKNPIPIRSLLETRYWLATGLLHLVLMLVIRKIDVGAHEYPKESANSPTKIAHDFCGFFVCFWVIASLGLPRLAYLIAHPSTFAANLNDWVTFFLCAVFFILMTLYDITHPATKEDCLKMHPPYKHRFLKFLNENS